ncbi:MAG: hypothetical protein ACYCPN_07410 [Thermoplasmata archaeon]
MTAPAGRSRPGDPGLWERFRAIRPRITYHPLERPLSARPGHRADRVTLNEQTARRELRPGPDGSVEIVVDSGPLGALLLLLEWDDRDESPVFVPVDRGEPAFPEGAIIARFGGPAAPSLPAKQILDLARFALP